MQKMYEGMNESDNEIKVKIDNFAKETINEVEKKSKLLNSTINNISNISDVGSTIDDNIKKLEQKVRSLEPNKSIFQNVKNKLFFNPVKKYFKSIKMEESSIAEIVGNLEKEKQVLKNDNITLQIECERIKNIIELLEKECDNGINYRELISKRKNDFSENDNIVEKLDKKISDLKEMLIVKRQSMLAIELIINNNSEIIRNIDRIKNVTIEALNTSVIVAKSLYNQKLVLSKINSVKKMDEKLNKKTISNFNELKNQPITIDNLNDSFKNVINTIDDVKTKNYIEIPENEEKILELKKEKN